MELATAGCMARRLPLSQFLLGPRKVALGPGELVSALCIPESNRPALSDFRKIGARKYLLISITMVALMVELDESGAIGVARVAVGACGPVARRLPALEAALLGCRPGEGLEEWVEPAQLDVLTPIDDVRASAAYRIDATLTLLRRMLAVLGPQGMAP